MKLNNKLLNCHSLPFLKKEDLKKQHKKRLFAHSVVVT